MNFQQQQPSLRALLQLNQEELAVLANLKVVSYHRSIVQRLEEIIDLKNDPINEEYRVNALVLYKRNLQELSSV